MKKFYTLIFLFFLINNLKAQDLLFIKDADGINATFYVQPGGDVYVEGGIKVSGTGGGSEDYLRNDGNVYLIKDPAVGQSDLTIANTIPTITFYSSSAAIPSGTIHFDADNETQGIYGGVDAFFFNLATNSSLSPTIDNGCNDYIVNDLNIGGSYFKINGNLLSLYGTISGSGSLYGSSSSNVSFNGASGGTVGTVKFTAGNEVLNNMIVQRSGASPMIDLGTDVNVNGILTLSSGIVNTGANKVNVANTSAGAIISSGGNTNYTVSWINGNLRRQFTSGSSGTFDFPVGNSSRGNLAQINSNALTGISYFDSYFQPIATGGANNNANMYAWETGLPGTPYHTFYTGMNAGGTWVIEPNVQPTGGNYDVHLYFNGFTGLTDNKFGVLKRPLGSVTYADFLASGGTINVGNGLGRLISDGYALRMGLTSFSEFGVGQSGIGLPIELTTFTGINIGDHNHLMWSTASEINSDHFEVEHSLDAKEFLKIADVKAAGISNSLLNYSTDHNGPLPTINYYRLKIVDADQSFKYSNVIAIDNSKNSSAILVYPNPSADNWNFQFNAQENRNIHIQLTDELGRIILTKDLSLKEGMNNYLLDENNLSSGSYFLTTTFNDTNKTEIFKLVKTNY